MLTTPDNGIYSNNILGKSLGEFSYKREVIFKALHLETPGPDQYEKNLSLMGKTPRFSLNNNFSGPFYDKNKKNHYLKTKRITKDQNIF